MQNAECKNIEAHERRIPIVPSAVHLAFNILHFTAFPYGESASYDAVTTVLIPPRTEKSPTTVMRRG